MYCTANIWIFVSYLITEILILKCLYWDPQFWDDWINTKWGKGVGRLAQITFFWGESWGCLSGTQKKQVSNSSVFRSQYSVSVSIRDIYWSNAFLAFEIFLVKLLPTLVKLLNSFEYWLVPSRITSLLTIILVEIQV